MTNLRCPTRVSLEFNNLVPAMGQEGVRPYIYPGHPIQLMKVLNGSVSFSLLKKPRCVPMSTLEFPVLASYTVLERFSRNSGKGPRAENEQRMGDRRCMMNMGKSEVSRERVMRR